LHVGEVGVGERLREASQPGETADWVVVILDGGDGVGEEGALIGGECRGLMGFSSATLALIWARGWAWSQVIDVGD
jgi:hypothetical protein